MRLQDLLLQLLKQIPFKLRSFYLACGKWIINEIANLKIFEIHRFVEDEEVLYRGHCRSDVPWLVAKVQTSMLYFRQENIFFIYFTFRS